MKIVAFTACNSFSEPAARMSKIVLDMMIKEGYEVENIAIGTRSSLLCCSDHTEGALSMDVFISEAVKKLEKCDGFFISTPVVAGGLASSMSTFLERISEISLTCPGFLRGKVGGMFATAGHTGGIQTIYQIVNFFYATEAIFTWARYWPMSWENIKPENPEADEEAMETIIDVGKQMIWLLKALA